MTVRRPRVWLLALLVVQLAAVPAALAWEGNGPALYKKWRRQGGPAVVHFYADWCGVCRRMAPEMSALNTAYGQELPVIFLDVDTAQGGAIAEHHGVSGLPHTEFFATPAEMTRRFVGYVSRHRLFEAVAPLLPPVPTEESTLQDKGTGQDACSPGPLPCAGPRGRKVLARSLAVQAEIFFQQAQILQVHFAVGVEIGLIRGFSKLFLDHAQVLQAHPPILVGVARVLARAQFAEQCSSGQKLCQGF